MEATPSTCFLGRGLVGGGTKCSHVIVRLYPLPAQRFLPASCRMRQRNFSVQNKKHQAKKINLERPTNTNSQHNGDSDSDPSNLSKDSIIDSNQEMASNERVPIILEDIHILNHAQIYVPLKILKNSSEKEELQGEINILEMKLAETDARLKVAAKEKIHVELLEEHLEKLQSELTSRGSSEEHVQDMNNFVSSPQNDLVKSFSQELDLLRAENVSLKDELQVLKAELSNIKDTDQRVKMLEEERSFLESALKELEFKLTASHEDISSISSLKSECQSLYEKVDDLQTLLDKATKQADQAILVLQQNQELRKKVDQLEESLNEANAFRLSSEKMQQYNELMQQKMKLLDERVQRSDEEIHSYVQLYQDSIKEFQDTLNNLKEESKKRIEDKSVLEKPREFWSNLLLMVDGWFLEKKISMDQAKVLREMIWNKEESICDAYMSSKEKNEREIIATFLNLTSLTAGSKLSLVVHCGIFLNELWIELRIQCYEKSVLSSSFGAWAEVGGLGDVVTGLSKALQKKGHLVEIVLPKYDCMQYDLIRLQGLPVYFIEPHHPSKFFWRGQFYGEHDDFKRFSFFSRAALELLLQAGKKPDIIHCHDWQTAFVAPLYWDLYVPKGLNSARICFTCHNFEYQGAAPFSELASCGLDVYQLNRPDRMQDNSANDRVNPVKVTRSSGPLSLQELKAFWFVGESGMGPC
ncbi:hypothetical protein DH2020_042129 [Rehmannia glutinosa]|uniref:starch synthase n=1 Tax=Rehmannia glutinosa TaxID=99300 RepID=A0ABR0UPD9_REHGL